MFRSEILDCQGSRVSKVQEIRNLSDTVMDWNMRGLVNMIMTMNMAMKRNITNWVIIASMILVLRETNMAVRIMKE